MKLLLNGDTISMDGQDSTLSRCDPSGRSTQIKQRLDLPEGLQSFDPQCVLKVTLAGKDVEHWGGNFGTRFFAEKLFLELQATENNSDDKSLVKKFDTNKIELGDDFGCFFSAGNGQSYFIDGVQVGDRFWNNLSEFDWTLGYQRSAENIQTARLDFDGIHWIGGTSLVLKAKDPEVIILQEFERISE